MGPTRLLSAVSTNHLDMVYMVALYGVTYLTSINALDTVSRIDRTEGITADGHRAAPREALPTSNYESTSGSNGG